MLRGSQLDLASWLTNFANLLIKHYDLDGVMDVIYTSRRGLAFYSRRTATSKTLIFCIFDKKSIHLFSSFGKVATDLWI